MNDIRLHVSPDPLQERGLEKEKQFAKQLLQKELEEERARIPKANPYPYTTDFPVVRSSGIILNDSHVLLCFHFLHTSAHFQMPSKPEPKQCTRPEGFQLESLIRHEEELQRRMEEKRRTEREEAQRRIFRAQPILKE